MSDDPILDILTQESFPINDGIELPRRSTVPPGYDTSQLLSNPFRTKEFVRAFADAVSNTLDVAVERQRRALSVSREPENITRALKIRLCRMLGLDYRNDVLTDDDYDRLINFLAIYNRQKGPDHFIRFLGFVKNTDFSLVRLWTTDYIDFQGAPDQGQSTIMDTPPGPWYPTTHVGILYPDQGGIDALQPADVEKLFYQLAPINLVLLWIAAQTKLPLAELMLCTNMVETTYEHFIAEGAASSQTGYSLYHSNGTINPNIVSSRDSHATMYDSTGKMTYAPSNLLQRSQEFNEAIWTPSNTTILADNIAAPDGTTTAAKMRVNTTNAVHYLRQIPTVINGKSLTSIYVKAGEITKFMLYLVGDNLATGYDLTAGTTSAVTGFTAHTTAGMIDAGGGWWRCWAINPDRVIQVRLHAMTSFTTSTFAGANTTDGLYLWGAQSELITYQTAPRTYIPTTDALIYKARVDYNPTTLGIRGLLCEPTRTNSHTYSGDFTNNTGWALQSGLVSRTNNVVAPDGTTTGTTFVEDTTSVGHYIVDQVGARVTTTAVPYTLSVYLKAGTRRYVILSTANTGNGFYCIVDTQTWTITANAAMGTGATFSYAQIRREGSWYRVCLTGTPTATAQTVTIAGATSGTYSSAAPTYLGDSSTIIAWGLQLEDGNHVSTYIPTTTTGIVRENESHSLSSTAFSTMWTALGNEFTILARGISMSPANAQRCILQIGAGSQAFYVRTGTTTSTSVLLQTYDGSPAQITFTNATIDYVEWKVAWAVKVGDQAASVNGSAVSTSAATTFPTTTPTQLNLGTTGGTSEHIAGWITGCGILIGRSTNAQLVAFSNL